MGEVEHLAAAALCQQVVDVKAAGLAIGDELDGLCAMLLQVVQGVQVAGKSGGVVGTGVGAQGAVLAHGKGLIHALSVHHPQLKGAVGVGGLALGGTAVGGRCGCRRRCPSSGGRWRGSPASRRGHTPRRYASFHLWWCRWPG